MPVNTARRFNAVLRLETGQIIAQGYGRIHLAEKAVSFESDFVPLYPLGTPMEMLRLFDGKPIHRFWGKVYLSSKQLMKLVSVDDELLPGADVLYCRNLTFSADFALLPPKENEEGLRALFRHKPAFEPISFRAPVAEISPRELTFHYDVELPFETGQQFIMRTHMPLAIPETVVQIIKPLWFGQAASYRCSLIGLNEVERENICCFLQQYHLRRHKLF